MPILIGVCTDMSSVYSDAGGMGSVEAARLDIDDFGGRVLGRPVQVLYADNLNKADNAASIVRKWIDVDKISMALDINPSSAALAIQAITKEKTVSVVRKDGRVVRDMHIFEIKNGAASRRFLPSLPGGLLAIGPF